MAYQRGSLKQVPRKEGDTWMLRYRVVTADGRRVENGLTVGLVRDFPSEKAAWREVDRLGLLIRINSDAPAPGRIRFNALCEHYLKADFGADAVRPKSANTIPIVEHYVRDYLSARWGTEIAEDIRPLEIQRWFKSLHTDKGLAWTTIAKMRGIMHRVSVGNGRTLRGKCGVCLQQNFSAGSCQFITANGISNANRNPLSNRRAIAAVDKHQFQRLEISDWNYTDILRVASANTFRKQSNPNAFLH
jgi:hypothetical protein